MGTNRKPKKSSNPDKPTPKHMRIIVQERNKPVVARACEIMGWTQAELFRRGFAMLVNAEPKLGELASEDFVRVPMSA